MKIDLAIPSYKMLLHPHAKVAMDALIAYSGCKCFSENGQLAGQMYETLKAKKKLELPAQNPFHHPSECPLGKHDLHVIPQVNSCVIHWSRNDLLTRRRPDADSVLFADDDVVLPRETLEKLLSHKVDIVGALCTKRVDPPEPVHRQWVEEVQDFAVVLKWPVGKLIEVDGLGTGVMLLSRRVIEDVARAYHPDQYEKTGNGFWFKFLQSPRGNEWGEDMSFCFKAARLGYKIHVDTSIYPLHMGDWGFNIEDFLEYQQAVIAAGGLGAFRALQQKTEGVERSRLPLPSTM